MGDEATAIDEELRSEFIDYLNYGNHGIHDAPLYLKDSSRPGCIRWTAWGEEKFTSEKEFLPRYREFLNARKRRLPHYRKFLKWRGPRDEEDED